MNVSRNYNSINTPFFISHVIVIILRNHFIHFMLQIINKFVCIHIHSIFYYIVFLKSLLLFGRDIYI